MRVYLDNCCYNRPYDDQSQVRISLEAQAKLHVQDLIRADVLELAASYVLSYENSRNPYPYKRLAIDRFVEDNASVYVDASHAEEVATLAHEWLADGLHAPDAHHAACAILAGCDVLLTTDDRFLKRSSPRLTILDPHRIRETPGGYAMTPPATLEIMDRGIRCLVDSMGATDTERFISVLLRERFDYTLWRRHFDDVPADDWNRAAANHARLHPFRPKRAQRPLPESPCDSLS